jgi:hypothetical protein
MTSCALALFMALSHVVSDFYDEDGCKLMQNIGISALRSFEMTVFGLYPRNVRDPYITSSLPGKTYINIH